MTAVLSLLGAGAGVGLVLAASAMRRSDGSLAAAVDRYRVLEWTTLEGAAKPAGSLARRGRRRRIEQLGLVLAGMSERAFDGASQAQDLAMTGRSLERHALALVWGMLAGAGVPGALATALALLGLRIPVPAIAALALVGGLSGASATAFELRRAARGARERFRRAFSSWLELVSLAQAGGMGIEGALEAASRISSDDTFRAISHALDAARHAGSSPWAGMTRLGHDLGIPELDELASSLALAGSEGARIRSSLDAKSASLRRRQMAEAEAKANATTERLFLPSIVLMLGFMVFLMYPAAVSLAHVI